MWFPVREADPSLELYSLKWETDELCQLGGCLVKTATTVLAAQAAKFWLAAMSTLAAALFAALALPMAVLLVSGAIDNSWTVVHNRAKKVGKILANTLVDKIHGNRPVTLIGVSLGSQVLFSCLKHLLKLDSEGKNVKGIIENVFFLGSACSSDPIPWDAFKSIVSGRVVNGYCKSDWILGLVHRTAGMTYKAAGLNAIESKHVENIDLGEIVSGHLSYKKELPNILKVLQIGRSINVQDWDIKNEPEDTEKEEKWLELLKK